MALTLLPRALDWAGPRNVSEIGQLLQWIWAEGFKIIYLEKSSVLIFQRVPFFVFLTMLTIEHIANRLPRSFYHLLRPHMFVFKLPVGSYHTISPEMQKVDPHNNLMMRQSACCLYCPDGVDTKLQGIKQPGSTHIWELRARWRWLFYPNLWIERALSFPW